MKVYLGYVVLLAVNDVSALLSSPELSLDAENWGTDTAIPSTDDIGTVPNDYLVSDRVLDQSPSEEIANGCQIDALGAHCGSISSPNSNTSPVNPGQQSVPPPQNSRANPSSDQPEQKMCKYYESRIDKWYTGYCNPGGTGKCKAVDLGNGQSEKMLSVFSADWCDIPNGYQCCIKPMRCLAPYSAYNCMTSDGISDGSGTDAQKNSCIKSGGFLEAAPIAHCPKGSRCCLETTDGVEFDPSTMDQPIIHNKDGSYHY